MTFQRKLALTLIIAAGAGLNAMGQGAWLIDPGQQQIYTNPVATDVKVGIGLSEPDEMLEVAGNALIHDNVGINTTVTPTQELYVRGQMYMGSTGFMIPTSEDKISLVGDQIGDAEMTGFGYESELVDDGGLLDNKRVLVNKAEYGHRWYINSNADGGSSSIMSLRARGLGINVDLPDAGVHVNAIPTQDVFRGEFQGDLRFVVQENGRSGFNVDDALADLHLNGDVSMTQFLMTPNQPLTGGSTEILMGEDDDFTYGMALRYDGGDNRFYFMGQGVGGASGPHFSIERDNGDVGIGYGSTVVPSGYKLATAGSVFLRPALGVTDGTVSLMLGEDDDNGLIWRYNGVGNKLHLDGISGGTPQGTHMTIERTSGDVTIGYGESSAPAGYKLAVDGNVICESVRVDLSEDWPDYVFESDYNLMSISDLKASIETNGHLPGIPAADIMEAEGIDLGDMQKRMMEKIEELTLYVIELQDQIETLKASN